MRRVEGGGGCALYCFSLFVQYVTASIYTVHSWLAQFSIVFTETLLSRCPVEVFFGLLNAVFK